MNNPIYNDLSCSDIGNVCASSNIGVFILVGTALLVCAYYINKSRTGQIEPLSTTALFLIASFYISAAIWSLNIWLAHDWLTKLAQETASFWNTFIFFVVIWFFVRLPIEMWSGNKTKKIS